MKLSVKNTKFTEFIQISVQTQQEYKTYLRRRLKEVDIDLSFETFQVLMILWEEDGVNQQVLADCLHKDKATLTYLLDNLCKKGFVRRKEDPTDRRNKLIFLTKKGIEIEDRVLPMMKNLLETASKDISAEELNAALDLFKKVHMNLGFMDHVELRK